MIGRTATLTALALSLGSIAATPSFAREGGASTGGGTDLPWISATFVQVGADAGQDFQIIRQAVARLVTSGDVLNLQEGYFGPDLAQAICVVVKSDTAMAALKSDLEGAL